MSRQGASMTPGAEPPPLEYTERQVVTTRRTITPESNRRRQQWYAAQAKLNRLHTLALIQNAAFDLQPLPLKFARSPLVQKLRRRVDHALWAGRGQAWRARWYPDLTDQDLRSAYQLLERLYLPVNFYEAVRVAQWAREVGLTSEDLWMPNSTMYLRDLYTLYLQGIKHMPLHSKGEE